MQIRIVNKTSVLTADLERAVSSVLGGRKPSSLDEWLDACEVAAANLQSIMYYPSVQANPAGGYLLIATFINLR